MKRRYELVGIMGIEPANFLFHKTLVILFPTLNCHSLPRNTPCWVHYTTSYQCSNTDINKIRQIFFCLLKSFALQSKCIHDVAQKISKYWHHNSYYHRTDNSNNHHEDLCWRCKTKQVNKFNRLHFLESLLLLWLNSIHRFYTLL